MAQAQAARRQGVDIFDESRPLWVLFFIFLVPMMLSNILQSASQTLGSVFLGRLIGTDALAAVSAVFPVVFFLFAFLIGIASGSSVLIGQAYGAGDHHRVKKVAGTVLGATVAFSIIVAIIGTLFAHDMLGVLGTPKNIIASSDAYTRVVFLTAPILFPYLVYTTFLRGTGDSTTPFYFLILSSVLSVGLTPAFILGWAGLPKLGVVSVAVAALVSQGVAFAAFLIRLSMVNHPLKFDRETARDMIFDPKILWHVLRIGIPTGLQVIMVSLAEVAVISFVNRFGSSATAAYGAVNMVESYVQFPAISIGISASIFGAQCIGARREDMLGKVVRTAVGMNYVIGGMLVALCYTFAWQIVGWFIVDPRTLEIAHTLLMITLWSYLLFGNSSVMSGIMRSSGVVLWPTINGIFSIWAIEVPAAYILMHYFGLNGVWMGYPISFVVVVLLQYAYYNFFWKRRTHERLV
jgi:putative MATE family efflux protein